MYLHVSGVPYKLSKMSTSHPILFTEFLILGSVGIIVSCLPPLPPGGSVALRRILNPPQECNKHTIIVIIIIIIPTDTSEFTYIRLGSQRWQPCCFDIVVSLNVNILTY